MRTISSLLLLAATAVPVLAQDPVPAQDPVGDSEIHLIREGDTLWDLARRYLDDPFRWPEIYRLNQNVVRNPDLIFPSDRLRLPPGAGRLADRPLAGADPREAMPAPALPRAEARTVFYTADTRRERSEVPVLRSRAELALPIFARGDYYRAGFFAEPRHLEPVGTLEELLNETNVPMRMPALIMPYDRVFVRLSGLRPVEVGEVLHVFRQDRRVRPFGWLFISTGTLEIEEIDGEIATAVIREVYDEIAPGDLALTMTEARIPVGVEPQPVSDGAVGRVIAIEMDQPVIGQEDVLYVDLGTDIGVSEGDILSAYEPADERERHERPEIEIARLQIVRAEAATSAARVIGLDQPSLREGLPVRVVSRVPR